MMSEQVVWQGPPVHSWAEFHEVVKRPDRRLLERLDEFGDSVLVAGCQRSGTTALSRLLKRADGIADYAFGHDDELDGALLLAGHVVRSGDGRRHCFQTTYLNDRFPEYFEHEDFRLIWMLREPRSVVYSMLHNWRRGALNRLFEACGAARLERRKKPSASAFRLWMGPSRLEKACASYVAKTEQTFALRERLGPRMAVVDYDDLVAHKEELLPQLCEFVSIPYSADLARQLHGKSVHKRDRLAPREARYVDEFCDDAYRSARKLRTIASE